MRLNVWLLVLLSTAPFLGYTQPIPSPENLLSNGNFQTGEIWPEGWTRKPQFSLLHEGTNRWLAINAKGGEEREITLDPDWAALLVSCRMRTTAVVSGKQIWEDARLTLSFVDASGQRTGNWPEVFHGSGTSDWVHHKREYEIPPGATTLRLGPHMLGLSGRVEFDDIAVSVSRKRPPRTDLPAPDGITNPWDHKSAWQERSETRHRLCLNGLWRFLPVVTGEADPAKPPSAHAGWGWFKVPGLWPEPERRWNGDPNAQHFLLPACTAAALNLRTLDQAWYRRTFLLPHDWQEQRIFLDFTLIQSHVSVLIDGIPAGSRFFPGGRVEITDLVQTGQQQVLDVLLTARPLSRSAEAFMAPDEARRRNLSVTLKGITGDVFVASEPMLDRIGDIRVVPSYRNRDLTLDVAVRAVSGARRLSARITREGASVLTFQSPPFDATSITGGRIQFSTPWENPALWDPASPGNLHEVTVALETETGTIMDESLPVTFGFREFWIEGRDFFLNGIRTPLRALVLGNMAGAADRASFEGAKRACLRLQALGFNAFITSNYDFSPGSVSYIDGLLAAADETGMLCAFTLPHIKDFEQRLDKPEQAARYRQQAEWLIQRVQNHPAVVLFAMNHNATGYEGDQNPLLLDGRFDPEALGLSPHLRQARHQARLAEALVRTIDASRPIYHHQSGNLGDLHTINIYLNWAPIQERNDWLGEWAQKGTKPLFFVEWGLPHIASWSSYRGPQFIWGAKARQSAWNAEYAASFIGDSAYAQTNAKNDLLDHEASLWQRPEPFTWSALIPKLLPLQKTFLDIMALYASENWRTHRAWRLSASLPWDQGLFWTRTAAFHDTPVENPNRWNLLQQPGIIPDLIFPRDDFLYHPDPEAMRLTALGEVFKRWNQPCIGFIGGGPVGFTEKSHIFTPGSKVQKRLVLINDSREDTTCAYEASSDLPGMDTLTGTRRVPAGARVDIPLHFKISPNSRPGSHVLRASFVFGDTPAQTDALSFDVLPAPPDTPVPARIACHDPKGLTRTLLDAAGVAYSVVPPDDPLENYDLFIVGREGIDFDTAFPGMTRVADGLNVLIFEQPADILEQRLGFRIQEHGLRNLFVRTPEHPAIAGIKNDWLRDWRGEATLLPPYVSDGQIDNPLWRWAGFLNTRVWRCGNRGTVASVLIEKPDRGNFLPLVDGGFDLQYAPLLAYAEGRGRILFCQLDVSGRTEEEPAAHTLIRTIIGTLGRPHDAGQTRTWADGNPRFIQWLHAGGLLFHPWTGEAPTTEERLVIGPGARHLADVTPFVENGTDVLAIGMNMREITQLLPNSTFRLQENRYGRPLDQETDPALAGISSADTHWRMRVSVPLPEQTPPPNPAVQLIRMGKGRVVICPVAPWDIDTEEKPYLRTTARRTAFLANRLLHNIGSHSRTPLVKRLATPSAPWRRPIPNSWKGHADSADIGMAARWFEPDHDDSLWRDINVPGFFEDQFSDLADFDGVFWYRNTFATPALIEHEPLTLHLGAIDDESWVWLNGVFLGAVTAETNPEDHWSFPREYELPRDALIPGGKNVLVVRVNDLRQKGGMTGHPAILRPAAWLDSFHSQPPVSEDDPYRYYRW